MKSKPVPFVECTVDEGMEKLLKSSANQNDLPEGYILDQELVHSLWYSIAGVRKANDLQAKIIPFFKNQDLANKDRTLKLLEILEYLYSKNNYAPLLKALNHPIIIEFLANTAKNGEKDVQEKSLFNIFVISNKLRTNPDVAPLLDLKKDLLLTHNLIYDKPNESAYFNLLKDNNSLSPSKRRPQDSSRFEALFPKTSNKYDSVNSVHSSKPRTSANDNSEEETELFSPQIAGRKRLSIEEMFSNKNESQSSSTLDTLHNVEVRQRAFSNKSSDTQQHGEMYPIEEVPSSFEQHLRQLHREQQQKQDVQETKQKPIDTLRQRTALHINAVRSIDAQFPKLATQNTDSQGSLSPAKLSTPNRPLQSPSGLPELSSPDNDGSANMSISKLSLMIDPDVGILTLEELLEYKRVQCDKKECRFAFKIMNQDDFLRKNDTLACPCYHNTTDQRRYPLHKQKLAKSFYAHDKLCEECFNDPRIHRGRCYYCRNWFEVYFHPKNYKLEPCKSTECDSKPLRRKYCPLYHNAKERDEWNKLLLEGFQYDRTNVAFEITCMGGNVVTRTRNYTEYTPNNVPGGSPYMQSSGRRKTVNEGEIPRHPNQFHHQQHLQNHPQQHIQQHPQQHQMQHQQMNYYNNGGMQMSDYSPTRLFNPNHLARGQWMEPNNPMQYTHNQGVPFQQQQPFMNTNNYVEILSPTRKPEQNPYMFSHPQISEVIIPNSPNRIKPRTNEGFAPTIANEELQLPNLEVLSKDIIKPQLLQTPSQKNVKEHYIYGDKLNLGDNDIEENKLVEFKHFRGPKFDDLHWSQILKTVGGFLNSEGGQLYIGVNDYGDIEGTKMDYKDYDMFKSQFITNMLKRIDPPLDDHLFSIKKTPVKQGPREEIRSNEWRYIVIEITIKRGEKVYFVKEDRNQLCYQRFDGSTRILHGAQINDLFCKRRK